MNNNSKEQLIKQLCEEHSKLQNFFGNPVLNENYDVNNGLSDPIKKTTDSFNSNNIASKIADKVLKGFQGQAADSSTGNTPEKPGEAKKTDPVGKPENNGEAKDPDLVSDSELSELFDGDDERESLSRLIENLSKLESSYEEDEELNDFFTECGCLKETSASDEDDDEEDEDGELDSDLELEFGDPDDDEIDYEDEELDDELEDEGFDFSDEDYDDEEDELEY